LSRTKYEAITYVFLISETSNQGSKIKNMYNYITIFSDTSNHKDVKLFSILVQFFHFEKGIQTSEDIT